MQTTKDRCKGKGGPGENANDKTEDETEATENKVGTQRIHEDRGTGKGTQETQTNQHRVEENTGLDEKGMMNTERCLFQASVHR